jgi:NADPH-dependent 2,4-dienoyl-CoA reductase/sulfur reductase-like enzyme
MDNAPLVVVGSGLAAWTVVKEFRKHDSQTPVTLVTASSVDAYPKPVLSTAFAQNKLPGQLRNGVASELAATLNLQLQAHTRALSLNLTAQTLHTDHGDFAYSRLVLAHGAAQRSLVASWTQRRKKGRETISALPSRFIAEMALDKDTVREDPRERLKALRAEFAQKAAASAAAALAAVNKS